MGSTDNNQTVVTRVIFLYLPRYLGRYVELPACTVSLDRSDQQQKVHVRS